jgi:hypothetical protein
MTLQLLPAVRDLYFRLPETYLLEPWELVHVLYSLGYTDDPVDEAVISSRGLDGREKRLPTVEASRMTLQHLMYRRRVGMPVHKTDTERSLMAWPAKLRPRARRKGG